MKTYFQINNFDSKIQSKYINYQFESLFIKRKKEEKYIKLMKLKNGFVNDNILNFANVLNVCEYI